jgi:hypothetical protein
MTIYQTALWIATTEDIGLWMASITALVIAAVMGIAGIAMKVTSEPEPYTRHH